MYVLCCSSVILQNVIWTLWVLVIPTAYLSFEQHMLCTRSLFCRSTAGGSLAPLNDGNVRSQAGHRLPPPSSSLELNRTSSCYLATLSASMEIDVREIKGNSEIQTSVSLR